MEVGWIGVFGRKQIDEMCIRDSNMTDEEIDAIGAGDQGMMV